MPRSGWGVGKGEGKYYKEGNGYEKSKRMRRNMQATKRDVSLGRRNTTCRGTEAERI